MRWYVSRNGNTVGPLEEPELVEWLRSGQAETDAFFRDEASSGWVPITQTPFASFSRQAAPEAQGNAAAGSKSSIFTKHYSIGPIGGLVAIGLLGAGIFAATSRHEQATSANREVLAASAPEPAVPPEPAEPSGPYHLLASAADLPTAIDALKPEFKPTGAGDDQASLALAIWSASHLSWAALQAIPETQRALVMKDPSSELGKRLCWSGSVVEISTHKIGDAQICDGGIMNDSMDVVRFYAVGSSGNIVEHSAARICGIVTGTVVYENSGGGTTHAVHVVGMFDLPKNKPGYMAQGGATPKANRDDLEPLDKVLARHTGVALPAAESGNGAEPKSAQQPAVDPAQ